MALKLFEGSAYAKRFADDLRTLASFDDAELQALATWLEQTDRYYSIGDATGERLLKALAARPRDDTVVAVRITGFVLSQWTKLGLSLGDIVEDVRSLQLSDEEVRTLETFFSKVQQYGPRALPSRREAEWSTQTLPTFTHVSGVCELRAVFAETLPDVSQQAAPATYTEILSWLPTAVVRIETDEEEAKLVFQMTEWELTRLIDSLIRLRERLQETKKFTPPEEA